MRENSERRLNVSGVLRYLGVSRSGYNSWKLHEGNGTKGTMDKALHYNNH